MREGGNSNELKRDEPSSPPLQQESAPQQRTSSLTTT